MISRAPILEPICVDGVGRRADEDQPGVGARLGERRVLGQEAVAGMHGVGPGTLGGVDDRVGPQVRLGRRGTAERHGDVGVAHERLVGVGIRVHGDGGDTEVAARPHDAAGDLAPVGDQQPANDASFVIDYIRKTPKPRRPSTLFGVARRQTHAEHGARVARVDDAVVVDLAGHEQRQRLALDLLLGGLALDGVGFFVERTARGRGPTRRATIDITPASCSGPMIAVFEFG